MYLSILTYFYFLLWTFCYLRQTSPLHIRILRTPVIHWLPTIKAHHIVLYADETHGTEVELGKQRPPTYAVDFTPVEQGSLSAKVLLLFGHNVPAQIRIRPVDNLDIMNDSDETALEKILSPSTTAHYLSTWPTMNLYTRNCQHFSRRFINMLLLNNQPA